MLVPPVPVLFLFSLAAVGKITVIPVMLLFIAAIGLVVLVTPLMPVPMLAVVVSPMVPSFITSARFSSWAALPMLLLAIRIISPILSQN
jgi:hypothetical protein